MSSENKQEEDSTLKRGEKRGKEGDAQGRPARHPPTTERKQRQQDAEGEVKSPRQTGMKRNRLGCKT